MPKDTKKNYGQKKAGIATIYQNLKNIAIFMIDTLDFQILRLFDTMIAYTLQLSYFFI